MKKLSLLFIALVFGAFLFTGCQDRTDLTAPVQSPKSGNVDFSRYVAIGNSITAGYQSSALFESGQVNAYGNLIAQQVNTPFAMPLIADPGIGGKLYVKSLSPFVMGSNAVQGGAPKNLNYAAPYNNLGVPGALLYDVLNATSSTTCAAGLAGKPNAFFDIILRGLGTQFNQAKALHPTFVTLWIGNNDVLGYATSGGFSPAAPTSTGAFTFLYNQLADSLASLGAKVVVANLPNVTAIPFFTTVGPQMAFTIPWKNLALMGSQGLYYQTHGNTSLSMTYADSLKLLTGKVLITLPASSYASYLGAASGKWYKDNHYPGIPAGIDTTKPFGFHPQNPLPDALVLDSSEVATALASTSDFNNVIASIAAAKGFGLVDINAMFGAIRSKDYAGGSVYGGINFTTTFVTGGLFSLDGVHPTSQAHGIIANEFLKVINAKWGANYPMVDIGKLPGSITFSKRMFGQAPVFDYPAWFTYLK